jgi:cell division protein FtsB
MRWATLLLLALIGLVQAGLWMGTGGLPQVMKLQSQLDAAQRRNTEQKLRNDRLQAEVDDLRNGLEMVEDRARNELGMVKPDEIFVQLTARR